MCMGAWVHEWHRARGMHGMHMDMYMKNLKARSIQRLPVFQTQGLHDKLYKHSLAFQNLAHQIESRRAKGCVREMMALTYQLNFKPERRGCYIVGPSTLYKVVQSCNL